MSEDPGLEIALSREEFQAGEVVRGTVRGPPPGEAETVRVALVHDARHLSDDAPVERELTTTGAGTPFPFDLPLPPDAMPTFDGAHYGSTWSVQARIQRALARDVRTVAPIVVRPGPERVVDAGARPASGAWEGYRRIRRFLAAFVAVDLVVLLVIAIALAEPPWFVWFAFGAPPIVSLAMLGLLTLVGRSVERLEVSAPRARWRFGETIPVTVTCRAAPERLVALDATLRGEEVWTTSSGKSSQTHHVAFHEAARRLAGGDLNGARSGARTWSWSLDLELPASGPPSHGRRIRWFVEARAEVPRNLDPRARLSLEVSGVVPEGRTGA